MATKMSTTSSSACWMMWTVPRFGARPGSVTSTPSEDRVSAWAARSSSARRAAINDSSSLATSLIARPRSLRSVSGTAPRPRLPSAMTERLPTVSISTAASWSKSADSAMRLGASALSASSASWMLMRTED